MVCCSQDGPLQPGETPTVERATWPRTVKDFLSPLDPTFAKNFPLLAEHGLSFDLQCNPSQLAAAASFLSNHPSIPVVLDHIGSLRLHRGSKAEDEAILSTWKQGMEALAALPNVHVKLSMVGYSVDGWHKDPSLEAEVVSAFRLCIDLFGTKRCMVRASPRARTLMWLGRCQNDHERLRVRVCACAPPLCVCASSRPTSQ